MDENAPSLKTTAAFSNVLATTVCFNLTWRHCNGVEAAMWSNGQKAKEVEERMELMV